MPVFASDEQLYDVLQAVFERISEEPARIEPFTRSNLVIRMKFREPTAEVLLDGRQSPLEVFYGPRPGRANLEFEMEADLMHRIWLGEEKASQAFFSGRIQTRGNLMRAMPLLELFRECERVYPDVVDTFKLGT